MHFRHVRPPGHSRQESDPPFAFDAVPEVVELLALTGRCAVVAILGTDRDRRQGCVVD